MTGQPEEFFIAKTRKPDRGQSAALAALAARCRAQDGSRFTFSPDEEDAVFYLLNTVLPGAEVPCPAAALAVLSPDKTAAECIALTDPAFRRRGCFSALLDAAAEDFPDLDFFFPVSGEAPETRAALAAVGAEHDRDELQMCAVLTPCASGNQPAGRSVLPVSRIPHASFCLTPVSAETVCLHDVFVEAAHRGRGIGTAMIAELLPKLSRCGFSRVILHVSGDNAPAVSLYKKAGFRVTETLSFFLY